nr:unnamed protein product [Leishmania braziliensis]
MSWGSEKRHHSLGNRMTDPLRSSSAAPLAPSYSYTLAATQPQLQHWSPARTTATSVASINPALMTVAQQKARYARLSYAPPTALRHSRLHLGSTVDRGGVLGGTQHVNECPRALTHPATWSQPSTSTPAQHHTTPSAGSATRAAVNRDTILHPLLPPPPLHQLAPPPSEWCQALVVLQERQLLCWQQLTETQQLMTHHVEQLQEEVRRVHEVLTHRLGKHPRTNAVNTKAPNPDKRSRLDDNGRCEAAAFPKSAAAVRTASAATSQRSISVHAVRLLGESTTSTPALPQDAPTCRTVDQPRELTERLPSRQPADLREGNGGDGSAAHSQSTADAADSEADIFML